MPNVSPLRDMEIISKTSLSNHDRLSYMAFRKKLPPNYFRVFADILLGYVLLAAGIGFPAILGKRYPHWIFPLAFAGALSTGYWIAYLQLFIHEAAHFNLAPGKKWNDLVSNLFISSWAGQSTASYRIIHWDHHRFLGRVNDSEHSYFSPLNTKFFAASLSGWAALKVVFFRQKRLKTQRSSLDKTMMLAGLALNGTVMGILFFLGVYPFALAWGAGIFLFFPLFGALRQLLEHRDENAVPSQNYFRVPHGKFTRLFQEGPLGSTLGAAGFTRHLLHHWDPQIPYTRLGDVENFLMTTRLKNNLISAKTTYLKTFIELLEF